jgi:hypothetical protein
MNGGHGHALWVDGVALPTNPGRVDANGMRHPTWTPERIIAAIQQWAREHDGEPPAKTQWSRRNTRGGVVPGKPGSTRPSPRHVARAFGSWNAAIAAAGFEPRTKGSAKGENFYARRTHCKHGHEFTPENTLLRGDGARLCRACLKESARRRRTAVESVLVQAACGHWREVKVLDPYMLEAARSRSCSACQREAWSASGVASKQRPNGNASLWGRSE